VTVLSPSFSLEGQTAIVTGASAGLGAIMARALAGAGCALVLAARREERLEALAEELRADGARVTCLGLDIRERGHGERLVEAALTAHGRLDGVVLNAATSAMGPAEDEDLDAFSDVLAVNLTAQVELAGAGARAMIGAGQGGWMIALSSILSHRAGTGRGVLAYTTSKGAVDQMVRELARQWAPHGIRVNAIAPGYFPTALNGPMTADPGRLEAMIGRIPMGRSGEAEDLAGAVVFLASPAARYVTGHVLAVDGGMAAW
jgi:NAD(P)-dependent dehydrogenase (short-subunit alcohol dehydrogenase family)